MQLQAIPPILTHCCVT